MERVWELMNDAETKHHVPLYDETIPKGISYEQLRVLSGRVYAYLKAKNIGKEDFVLVKLPRGVQPIIAMIGVWRAGAALVIVEDTLAPERIEYIYNDCNCKIAITSEVWEEINLCEPLDGYEETDPHDAAYAVYTSGTTGNPKGVLHEYGNLERLVQSANYQGEEMFLPGERFALAAPLNFVASLMVLSYSLYRGCGASHILSYSTVKNPIALMKYLLLKRITLFFLTPTYAKKFAGKTGPFLKKMAVGSEPANHLYLKGVTTLNMYAQSESGVVTSMFAIDKEYDVCPVGKPQFDMKYRVVDDNGNDVPDGEIGEFVFENPYVRGYINLPEETAKAFRDGYFYTADLAKILPDGNIVICGRKSDMIKINGNRIEPAEIEATIRAVLNIDWCAVRGFVSDEHSFICAYYTDDITVDADSLRAELQKRLPYYMIPAYFTKIDSIPVKPNGKMDRNALPKPEIKNIERTYKEPTTEIEAALCNAMQKVLHMERIGIEDDFYEMGGDSLSSMELLIESGLPGLDAGSIFRGRTPSKIAELYIEQIQNRDPGSEEALNETTKLEEHKLTTEQLYMFDYQLYTPDSTMYNLFTMLRIEKEGIELDRMAKAIEMAIKNHPAFSTIIQFNEDGDLIQKIDSQMPIAITPEKISNGEFEKIKDNLVRPFKIVNSPLFRCRLFETEDAAYLFFDVHHIIFDGTSFKVFINSVINAYMGAPLENDYYYLVLQKREQMQLTDFYNESLKYFEEKYGNVKWTVCPKIDKVTRENKMGELPCEAEIMPADLALIEKKYMLTRNEFYIAATLLAIAISTNEDDVQVSWIYNGRDDLVTSSSIGLFFRDLPVALRLSDEMTLRDIFVEVQEQVQNGIKHSCYPYVEIKPQVVDGDITAVLYQRDIRDIGEFGGLSVEQIEIRQNKAASQSVLDIQILDGEEGLKYVFDYAASRYEDETMIAFQELFKRVVATIANNANADGYSFKKLKECVRGKNSLWQKLKDILKIK
ncbi:MAG: AMP-binding protein [Clostridia bacterium]|nr:AMP-binding protein [Clostridia bacterium]